MYHIIALIWYHGHIRLTMNGKAGLMADACAVLLARWPALCYTPWCWEERRRSWEQRR